MALKDCVCEKCVSACKRSPGWFAPGEAEKAAALLGMSLVHFQAMYLIVDFWVGGARVLVPRKLGVDSGFKKATWGSGFQPGRCALLGQDDRCRIHAEKPKECRLAMPCAEKTAPGGDRESIQKEWLDAGAPLGREH